MIVKEMDISQDQMNLKIDTVAGSLRQPWLIPQTARVVLFFVDKTNWRSSRNDFAI
jgi:hypothetical protein